MDKTTITYKNISKEVVEKFRENCNKKGLKQYKMLEFLMDEWNKKMEGK